MSENIFGDIPTWIMAIATPISIYFGFCMAKKQLKQNELQLIQNSKIEEQKFFLEIDKKLMEIENRKITNVIYEDVYRSQPFHIADPDTEKNLNNYLSDLEFVCNLYKEGIISKNQLDNLTGDYIVNAMKCESVKEFMIQERTITGNDYWKTVEEVAMELEPSLQILSTQNATAQTEPIVRDGITIYPDGTRIDGHGTIL